MKARSVVIQGALATLGLLAAYVTWQRPKETSRKESVVVVDATKNSLERVRYEDGARFIGLQKKERIWVTLAFLPGKRPSVDGGVELSFPDGGIRPAMAEPAPDRTVYANERADTLWSKLTPFEASRALGTLPQEKLTELGLTESQRVLELEVAGVNHRFTISRPVSGLLGTYAQNQKTGEVFLISPGLFNDLDPNSQLLVDRRFHLFKQTEFDTFTVKHGDKSETFSQHQAETPINLKVSRHSRPNEPDELAKNWHEKILNRLVVTEVLAPEELPKSGEPQVQLRVEYALKDKPKGWLELAFDSTHNVWARSENTASWVAVHQGAEDIIMEGTRLLQRP